MVVMVLEEYEEEGGEGVRVEVVVMVAGREGEVEQYKIFGGVGGCGIEEQRENWPASEELERRELQRGSLDLHHNESLIHISCIWKEGQQSGGLAFVSIPSGAC
ncbi:hypothetical protein Pmani_024712 [Petrolisthes manimaculis]|uniref:Uncharacterized protein n=1 Tax=Petrolisthes manimaculis TaxID=1843537 RepID=A0AAE1P7L0_9EUCA|nr:hypothetical protein Pmani_024712 [Petrolisthes manimaculis]